MNRYVNSFAIAFAVAAAFVAGPALAMQGADAALQTDLTQEQLDALQAILSSLPRQ